MNQHFLRNDRKNYENSENILKNYVYLLKTAHIFILYILLDKFFNDNYYNVLEILFYFCYSYSEEFDSQYFSGGKLI